MTEHEYAVKVNNVSKVYRLWHSPQDRLLYPLKKLWHSLPINHTEKELSGYREFYALNNISFEIRKGESWGFVGVNGSGKSTLLKIISGNLRPSSGSVEVDGKVAILDYGSGFNGEFTGKENIYLKATLLGLTRKQINERFNSIIDFAELGDFINQPVKTYSSGMVARLGFAIMAHVEADIIITDEALAVGDVFFVQKCMQFIRSFLKKGTFLFVSHATNDVLSLCQQAVWLDHGHVKAIGTAASVTQAYLDGNIIAKGNELSAQHHQPAADDVKENVKMQMVLGQPYLGDLMDYKSPKIQKDSRTTHHHLRNDIHIPTIEFSGGVSLGGVKILNVSLTDEEDTAFSWVVGGEMVKLVIEVLAERDLNSPIVGFQVLDRLGQSLFADNSFFVTNGKPIKVKANTIFAAEFLFQMPLLPVGDYVIRAAVAIGETEGEAVLLQTVNNALAFRSVTSGARHGLIGIPMHSISLKCKTNGDQIGNEIFS
jgi:homopolymeric O-antigen transport system ATP-binding protein